MLRACISIALLMSLPLSSIAAGPAPAPGGAIVSGGPGTTVGDVNVVTTMLAVTHELVETHSANSALLTVNGSVVTLLGRSKMKLIPNGGELMNGGMVVSTRMQYRVQSDCLSVMTVAQQGRYSVTPYGGRIYVHSEEGDTVVKSTKPDPREVRVPQGETLAIANACKPGQVFEFARQGDKAAKMALGAAAAAGAVVAPSVSRDISPDKRTASGQ